MRLRRWLLGLLCLPAMAAGHDLNVSVVKVIEQPGGFVVSVQTHLSQLASQAGFSAAGASSADVERALRSRLALRADGARLRDAHVIVDAKADMANLQETFTGSPDVRLEAPLYPRIAGSMTIFSRIRGGTVVAESVLTGDQRETSSFLRYVGGGISHIATGYDHIAFILGLVLIGGSLGRLVKVATAFTLAHSITLAASFLGFAVISPRVVEPLIAASVALVGIEAIYGGLSGNGRIAIGFGFGLVHGLGLAGGLSELGIRREAIPLALGSFNLGIEVAQLAIILAAAPSLGLLRRWRPDVGARVNGVAAHLVVALGIFWFVLRLLRPA